MKELLLDIAKKDKDIKDLLLRIGEKLDSQITAINEAVEDKDITMFGQLMSDHVKLMGGLSLLMQNFMEFPFEAIIERFNFICDPIINFDNDIQDLKNLRDIFNGHDNERIKAFFKFYKLLDKHEDTLPELIELLEKQNQK